MLSRLIAAAVLAAALGGCLDEDRVLRATCHANPNGGVTQEIDDLVPSGFAGGLLNTRGVSLGDIMRVSGESDSDIRDGEKAHKIDLGRQDVREEGLQNAIGRFRGGFDIETESDVAAAARAHLVDLEKDLESRTLLQISLNGRRTAIREARAVVNRDAMAVELIRADPRARWFLVSAVVYGHPSIYLFYTDAPLTTMNLIKVGNFYEHVEFVCADAMAVNSGANSSEEETRVAFFYDTLSYNESSRAVEIGSARERSGRGGRAEK